MMKHLRILLAALTLLALTGPAVSQIFWTQAPRFTGTAIGNGYDFNNGELYIANSPTMNASGPISIALWVKTTQLSSNYATWFLVSHNAGVRPSAGWNCSVYGGWRDQREAGFGQGLRLIWVFDCS
jgi:hypothetical protein